MPDAERCVRTTTVSSKFRMFSDEDLGWMKQHREGGPKRKRSCLRRCQDPEYLPDGNRCLFERVFSSVAQGQ